MAARKASSLTMRCNHRRIVMKLSQLKSWACAASLVAACSVALRAQEGGFNKAGNILISDQYNNRVIEVNPNNHHVVWHFGNGSSVAGPHSVVGVNDAQRIGPFTLIAGTGVPAQAEPTCPNGCADNRVLIVDPRGHFLWQYGHAGVTGAGPDQLNTPVQNTWLPSAHIFITDQGNMRIIEVTLDKRIVWQYGQTGVSGEGPDQLNNPNSAELLANGHVLIADENNNRVIEVNRKKHIVWSYGCSTCSQLSGAAFASRLPNGDTLITDSNNNRILEVDANDKVVWQYFTNTDPSTNAAPLPTRAVRLADGGTLISDQFNHRVIVVSRSKAIVR